MPWMIYLILRSGHRLRLEGRTPPMQRLQDVCMPSRLRADAPGAPATRRVGPGIAGHVRIHHRHIPRAGVGAGRRGRIEGLCAVDLGAGLGSLPEVAISARRAAPPGRESQGNDRDHARGLHGPRQNGSFTGHVRDSGRARTILPNPTDPEIVYFLTSGGGLWRTDNWSSSNTLWRPLTDDLPTTGGGSVAFGANPNTLYLGLGDPYDQILVGGAMVKSKNGGVCWSPIAKSTARKSKRC